MTQYSYSHAMGGSLRHRAARRFSAVLFAIAVSGFALGQDADLGEEDVFELDEFVVNSVRNSLVEAQEFKKNSDPFVDSIVAQDIGKLPDNTVADALQRVPGYRRFAAPAK